MACISAPLRLTGFSCPQRLPWRYQNGKRSGNVVELVIPDGLLFILQKTYLPEDNPADFSYYFDNSGRRTCYLAPERFLGVGDKDDGRGVTWAMDVFSVGCVIAELFLEAPYSL